MQSWRPLASVLGHLATGAATLAVGTLLWGRALPPAAPPSAPRPDAGLPAVGAGNLWGQHAPRTESPLAGLRSGWARENVRTDFNREIDVPRIHEMAWVDPLASVIGNVELGRDVFVAPFASLRGDAGQPIHVGAESNLQDGVVLHALETERGGQPVDANRYIVGGRAYGIYIGDRVSLAHQAQVHGPAWIESDVFVGMQALVFKAKVSSGVVIEPAARVIGVTIPPNRYVPAGEIVTDQQTADGLPPITYAYAFKGLNADVVHVHTSLAAGYAGRDAPASPARGH
ncbi:MAG: carbonic anhydrase [Myxococcota bacterium]